MKKINWHGVILTEKYYTIPDQSDGLELPLIKTPVEISDPCEIVDWTFSTQEDAKVHEAGCPKCESDTITATISQQIRGISFWRCVICGYSWETHRGIFIIAKKPEPTQLMLFEAVQ